MSEIQRSAGTVKWFSGQKGFGFIAPDDEGEDLFVHQSEIRADGFRTLREGQRVEFVVDSGDDGRSKAVEVVMIGGPQRSRRGRGFGGGVVRDGGRGGFGGNDGYGRWDDGGRGGYGSDGGGRGGRRGGRAGGGYGEIECYNCGGMGHIARDCYQGGGGGNGGGDWGYGGGGGGRGDGRGRGGYGGSRGGRGYGGRGGGGGRGRGGGGGGGACYNCGEEGHFARDCPNDQN